MVNDKKISENMVKINILESINVDKYKKNEHIKFIKFSYILSVRLYSVNIKF